MCSRFSSVHLIGATMHFSKFSLSPVARPKLSKIESRAATSDWTGLMKTTASSAYSESLSLAFLPLSGDSLPSSVATSSTLCSVSIARMNNNGDNGSPWRSLRACCTLLPAVPFRSTFECDVLNRILSHSLHLLLKPLCSSSSSMYSHETVSKAFEMSNLNSKAGVFVL